MQSSRQRGLDSVRRNGDAQLENVAGKNDIALLIVGPTGVGKSTFIRNVLRSVNSNLNPNVRDELQRFTDRVTQYEVQLPSVIDRRVILVDTPSFDRKSGEDALEVLRQISFWLASLYAADYKVSGIVFMYPIYPGRLRRIDIASFRVFRKLCGSRHFLRIIGVTTKWDSFTASEEVGESRERDIWKGFWKDISNRNEPTATNRLRNSIEQAMNVLNFILQQCNTNPPSHPLTIQKEIVDQGKAFLDTSAAKLLTSLLINKHDDPGRYSINRLILRFRQSTESIAFVTESGIGVEVSRHPYGAEVVPSIRVEEVDEEAGESANLKAANADLPSPYSSQQHCGSCTCFLHRKEAEPDSARSATQEPSPSVRISIASNDTAYYTAPNSPEAEVNTVPWPTIYPESTLPTDLLRPASVYLDVSMSASFSSSSSTLLPTRNPSSPSGDTSTSANLSEPSIEAPPLRMNAERSISMSASFSSSSSTLLPIADPRSSLSEAATQAPSLRMNPGHTGAHLGLLNGARRVMTGDIRANQIQGSNIHISGSNNTVNIYCSGFCQGARLGPAGPCASS